MMIKPEQIQDEVAEAAAKAAWEIDRKASGRSDFPLWEDLHPGERHIQIERQRAALAAGLAAWPGNWYVDAVDFEARLILPVRELLSEEIIRLERDKWV
jgi:hypothetical protein